MPDDNRNRSTTGAIIRHCWRDILVLGVCATLLVSTLRIVYQVLRPILH